MELPCNSTKPTLIHKMCWRNICYRHCSLRDEITNITTQNPLTDQSTCNSKAYPLTDPHIKASHIEAGYE